MNLKTKNIKDKIKKESLNRIADVEKHYLFVSKIKGTRDDKKWLQFSVPFLHETQRMLKIGELFTATHEEKVRALYAKHEFGYWSKCNFLLDLHHDPAMVDRYQNVSGMIENAEKIKEEVIEIIKTGSFPGIPEGEEVGFMDNIRKEPGIRRRDRIKDGARN